MRLTIKGPHRGTGTVVNVYRNETPGRYVFSPSDWGNTEGVAIYKDGPSWMVERFDYLEGRISKIVAGKLSEAFVIVRRYISQGFPKIRRAA